MRPAPVRANTTSTTFYHGLRDLLLTSSALAPNEVSGRSDEQTKEGATEATQCLVMRLPLVSDLPTCGSRSLVCITRP
jgi:hypothetical protein